MEYTKDRGEEEKSREDGCVSLERGYVKEMCHAPSGYSTTPSKRTRAMEMALPGKYLL